MSVSSILCYFCRNKYLLILSNIYLQASRDRPSTYRVVDNYDCRVAENLKRDIAEAKGITWVSTL